MLLFPEVTLKVSRALSLIIVTFFTIFCIVGPVYAHGWKAPEEVAKITNPIPAGNKSIELGKDIFSSFCATCHGAMAKGKSKEEADTSMDPPNLKMRLKNHSDGDFFWKIQNGKGDMPSFKEDLEDKEIWSLIIYLRHLLN
jgi:mono/diheme cytochrome c family protein